MRYSSRHIFSLIKYSGTVRVNLSHPFTHRLLPVFLGLFTCGYRNQCLPYSSILSARSVRLKHAEFARVLKIGLVQFLHGVRLLA